METRLSWFVANGQRTVNRDWFISNTDNFGYGHYIQFWWVTMKCLPNLNVSWWQDEQPLSETEFRFENT